MCQASRSDDAMERHPPHLLLLFMEVRLCVVERTLSAVFTGGFCTIDSCSRVDRAGASEKFNGHHHGKHGMPLIYFQVPAPFAPR